MTNLNEHFYTYTNIKYVFTQWSFINRQQRSHFVALMLFRKSHSAWSGAPNPHHSSANTRNAAETQKPF